jgi:hypothetical protein
VKRIRNRNRLLRRLSVLAWLGLGAAPAQAQLVQLGSSFQVNTYTTGPQFDPVVEGRPDGSFIVAWAGAGSGGDDTSGDSVHAQLYDAAGGRSGAELQVNELTTASQDAPSVAFSPDGGFVVAWESYTSAGAPPLTGNIQARRFTSAGAPIGGEFRVNTVLGGYQHRPAAAAGPGGQFVVVWQSNRGYGADSSGYSVQMQSFDSNGNKVGLQFQVNDVATGLQHVPGVSFLADGSFVVVWESDVSAGGDSSYTSIQGRRFGSNGAAQGAEFQVNTTTTGRQHRPSIAAASDGGFVVAWESRSSSGPDASGYSIQAQRYASTGAVLGAEFQVNADSPGDQRNPAVRSGPAGDFFVAWQNDDAVSRGSPGKGIRARLFRSDGNPAGGDLQVNTFVSGEQRGPGVAAGPGGRFVAVWESDGSAQTDGSGHSIQAQLFAPPTPTSTATPTPTSTGTPTPTPTGLPPTATPTATPSGSPGSGGTATSTATPNGSGTATPTGSPRLLGASSSTAGSSLVLALLVGSSLVLAGSRRRSRASP